jgi:sodium/pantothenate symporter
MSNQIILVFYVAAILALSLKLRQKTFSGFIISDRNVAHSAVIGIAFTAAYFSAASFLGMMGVTFTQGLIIALLLIALYYAIGGLPAIIWINALQVTLMLLSTVLLCSGFER